ncbi:MAG: hypothetical protein D6728_05450 [Cyanobacteria bacterium J055]|nr:MAG: hypothetical protein D6728_05450 [Cyanobacteria bacterium J055]
MVSEPVTLSSSSEPTTSLILEVSRSIVVMPASVRLKVDELEKLIVEDTPICQIILSCSASWKATDPATAPLVPWTKTAPAACKLTTILISKLAK